MSSQEGKEKEPQPIVAKSGEPYADENAAKSALTRMNLDPALHDIVPYEGGFAIKPKEGAGSPPINQKPPPVHRSRVPKEKYWWVRFNAKSNPNDTDDVQLMVNGETLVIRREVEVVVPDRFLECADHGTYPVFIQTPNKPRKVVGKIQFYPYTRLKEATEEEFLRHKAEGTRQMLTDIQRFGFDHVPDEPPM